MQIVKIPHSFIKRAIYSFLLIALVEVVGTLGMHFLEGTSFLDAFYFTSMLATGEGPSAEPLTAAGKVFASILAFLSVGTVITALIFVFGPFFGAVFRVGLERIEEEARREKQKLEGKPTGKSGGRPATQPESSGAEKDAES